MSNLIETARGLVDMICDAEPIVGLCDADEKRDYVERALGLQPPLVDDTFEDLVTGVDTIYIQPRNDENGKLMWYVGIPATREDHFQAIHDEDDEELPFDPEYASHLMPYGEVAWTSLVAAISSLHVACRSGDIMFNDGTVAE